MCAEWEEAFVCFFRLCIPLSSHLAPRQPLPMSPIHGRSMHLVPGSALGPFALGDSLWKVLEELRAGGENESGVTVRWDREVSL